MFGSTARKLHWLVVDQRHKMCITKTFLSSSSSSSSTSASSSSSATVIRKRSKASAAPRRTHKKAAIGFSIKCQKCFS